MKSWASLLSRWALGSQLSTLDFRLSSFSVISVASVAALAGDHNATFGGATSVGTTTGIPDPQAPREVSSRKVFVCTATAPRQMPAHRLLESALLLLLVSGCHGHSGPRNVTSR
jgi:hypothetical protein